MRRTRTNLPRLAPAPPHQLIRARRRQTRPQHDPCRASDRPAANAALPHTSECMTNMRCHKPFLLKNRDRFLCGPRGC